jgi:hypothetical protein
MIINFKESNKKQNLRVINNNIVKGDGKNIFLIKYHGDGTGGYISLGKCLYFPANLNMVGKRVRLKVEVIE